MVLGKLSPDPNSNTNPKPNPNPDRGGGQFSTPYVTTNEMLYAFLLLFSSLGVSLRVFSTCSLIR